MQSSDSMSVCMYVCLPVCPDSLGPRELEVTMINSIAHSVDTIHSQPVQHQAQGGQYI